MDSAKYLVENCVTFLVDPCRIEVIQQVLDTFVPDAR